MEFPNLKILQDLNIPIDTDVGYDEILEMRVKTDNERTGSLEGYDCKICKNKGYIAKIKDESEVFAECRCMKVRKTLRRIEDSGLKKQLRECTFKNYEIWGKWCEVLKSRALQFTEKEHGFLFIGGQSGCGKTHLCTATVGQFIRKGYSARYFVWRDDSPKLKALVNDPEYAKKISEYKNADVLYIDDLFKCGNNESDKVSNADVKLAFELIDFRARNEMITIISSNYDIEEIIDTDEPLGGRIFQMSDDFCINIPPDRNKNYRLRKKVIL